MKIFAQPPDGSKEIELIEVGPAEFEEMLKTHGEVRGIPQYWSQGLGIIPKCEPKVGWKFRTEQ